jgi:multidrug resistance efflux pump
MNRRVVGLGLTLAAVFVVGVWFGRREPREHANTQIREHANTQIREYANTRTREHANTPAARVETVTVQKSEHANTMEVTGTVKTHLTSDLAPKIMSKVAAVYVREGDAVRAGQMLVRLESADIVAQMRQAAAAVLAAKSALSQAQTGAVIQRTQSRTRVAQAHAALKQAEEQLSLVKEGARQQQKAQADEAVRQAEAGKAQVEEGVRQARAAFVQAQAQLSLVREGARKQQKLQADAAVRQAEANLKTAQTTYDRFKPLAEEGVITKQKFDEIALQLEVAKSQHETAKQQASLVYEGARTQEVQQAEQSVQQAEAAVRMAQQKMNEAESGLRTAQAQRDLTYEGARTQEVKQAEAQVKQAEEVLRLARASTDENKIKTENVKMLRAQLAQAEANLSAARVTLSYTTVTAPFSGVVIKRHVDPGAMAKPGFPLLTIVDSSGFQLESVVPESQMKAIHLGDEVPVTIDAIGRMLTGRVAQIVPSADPASRTFIVKIGLPKFIVTHGAQRSAVNDGTPLHSVPDYKLSPGMFGRAKFTVGKTQGIFVPETALWRKESLVGVFVVEKGTARKRLVTVGKIADGKAEILSGLEAGETIVARDVDKVTDGARVEGYQ